MTMNGATTFLNTLNTINIFGVSLLWLICIPLTLTLIGAVVSLIIRVLRG